MWSSHTLISKKLYRLPHSILEPSPKSWVWELASSQVDIIFAILQLAYLEMSKCWDMCFPSRAEGSTHMDVKICANVHIYFFTHTCARTHTNTDAQLLQRSSLQCLEGFSGILPKSVPDLSLYLPITCMALRNIKCGRQKNQFLKLCTS